MTDETGTFKIEQGELAETPELTVLALHGEIDGHTAGRVEAAGVVALSGGKSLVLELGEVTFIDSAGLRTMVALQRLADDNGTELRLRRPSRAVARLLELTALDGYFRVEN